MRTHSGHEPAKDSPDFCRKCQAPIAEACELMIEQLARVGAREPHEGFSGLNTTFKLCAVLCCSSICGAERLASLTHNLNVG